MAVKYTQIAELLNIMIRNVGRARYETLLKEIKTSQAFLKNQSFRETMERMERQLRTGKPKPPKTPARAPFSGGRGPLRG